MNISKLFPQIFGIIFERSLGIISKKILFLFFILYLQALLSSCAECGFAHKEENGKKEVFESGANELFVATYDTPPRGGGGIIRRIT